MPEHGFGGLSINEWLALISLISILIGGLIGLVKSWIIKPFTEQMSELGKSIKELADNSRSEHSSFDRRLDKHGEKLAKHDAELTVLYEVNNLNRRETSNDKH